MIKNIKKLFVLGLFLLPGKSCFTDVDWAGSRPLTIPNDGNIWYMGSSSEGWLNNSSNWNILIQGRLQIRAPITINNTDGEYVWSDSFTIAPGGLLEIVSGGSLSLVAPNYPSFPLSLALQNGASSSRLIVYGGGSLTLNGTNTSITAKQNASINVQGNGSITLVYGPKWYHGSGGTATLTMQDSSSMTIAASAIFYNGAAGGTGNIVLQGTSSASIKDAGTSFYNGASSDYGTITISNSANFRIWNNSNFYNSTNSAASNRGTITVGGGTLAIDSNAGFYNYDTLTINSGSVTANGHKDFYSVSNLGSTINLSGGTLNLFNTTSGNPNYLSRTTITGGTLNVNMGTGTLTHWTLPISISGSGVFNLISGTITNYNGNAPLNISTGGLFAISGGIFNNTNGNTVSMTDGIFSMQGGNFYNNNVTSISGGTIDMQSGTITNASSGSGTLTINNCNFDLTGGAILAGAGTSTINFFGATFNNSGIISSGILTNPSSKTMTFPSGKTFTLESTAKIANTGTFTNQGIFTNKGEVQATSGLFSTESTGTFNNVNALGKITINGGEFKVGTNGSFANNSNTSNAVNLTSGSFTIDNPTACTNGDTSAGTITVNGGTLRCLNGTFVNGIGAQGDINISTGALSLGGGALNNGAGAQGNINISSGTFTLGGGALYNGNGSTGNLTISGGLFELNSGTITNGNTSTGNIIIGSCDFNLNGGTFDKGSGTSNVSFFGTNLDGVSPIISNGTFANNLGLTFPSGKTFTLGSSAAVNNNSPFINNGLTLNYGFFTNDNQLTNNLGIIIKPYGTLVNNATFDNNLFFEVEPNGVFIDNGTFNNNPPSGSFFNLNNPIIEIPSGTISTIPNGIHFIIPNTNTLIINGQLINQSGNTVDIYGTVYTYSLISNGDGINPGTINIEFPGKLILLSGTLSNDNANSVVNIKQGGRLYNYYGTVNLAIGGTDSLDVKNGGLFDNARGNNPGTFTIAPAGNFFDSNEISLREDLDLDATWTITQAAIINGYGNKITLRAGGEILLQGPNASLLFDNVIVENIAGNNIRCTDNNTTLSVHNCIWNLDNTFSFTKGKVYVKGDWLIDGNELNFNYESDQAMTVSNDSALHLLFTTFNYDTAINNLITLDDQTSVINLENAKFLATQNCIINNGTLSINGVGILEGIAQLDARNLDGIDTIGALRRTGNVLI